MAPEPMPKVVLEEVPAEGAMIAARTAAPSPSHGAPAPFSPAPAQLLPRALQPAREWRWSWGIPPLMCRTTFPWVRP
jgi:hypothetical protein